MFIQSYYFSKFEQFMKEFLFFFLKLPPYCTVCAVLCLVTELRPYLWDPMICSLPGSSVHGDSPGKNTGMGCHALLQGIFPTQGSNPALPNFRWILYQLSQQGCPRILEWVAYPLSRRSSWPGNRTGVFCIAAGFFTIWATRETPKSMKMSFNACKESDTTEQLT